MTGPTPQDLHTARELGEGKGHLSAITALLNSHHQANNTRLNDLQKAIEKRFDTVEERLSTVEKNERSTAIKAAVSGAASGGLTFLVSELIRNALHIKGGA